MKCIKSALAVLILSAVVCNVNAADDTAAAGKRVAEMYKDAVVKVQLVTQMRISYEGREGAKRENKSESTATIIDPSGLTVVSLSATNPAETIGMMYADSDMDIKSQVTDVKLRMSDGTEIPAKVVLRDKDLDLAFVRPTQKQAKPFKYVDLSQSTRPGNLDQILVLCRLGRVANRTLATCLDRIQAIVEKPRTFYVPGYASMTSDMGAPVFGLDGKAVGILILRAVPKGGYDDGGIGMGGTGMLPMILPASDILKVAKQVPEDEPKAAAVKPVPEKAKTTAKPAAAKK